MVGLVAACDDGTPTTTTVLRSPVPEASAPDPAISEAATAQPGFDVGQTVHLTVKGIQPTQLVTSCCRAVIFKNESNGPMSIVFNRSKLSSGPIAPGATWLWTPPNPESVIYHLGEDPTQQGSIQVESPQW
jgi:hypothetical protein